MVPRFAAVNALAGVLEWRDEQHEKLCPTGCGCRYMTDDPDARECACDGPCYSDPDWWDGLTDYEAALDAAAPLIRQTVADEIKQAEKTAMARSDRFNNPTEALLVRDAYRHAARIANGGGGGQ